MVPRSEKRTIPSFTNLFLMEKLSDLEAINLLKIMLQNMHRVMTWTKGNHGIVHGYLLNWVFNHFVVPLGMGVLGTVKHMFSKSTLRDCECIEGKAPGRSQVAAVLEQQVVLKREVDDITVLLDDKEVEVVTLKSNLQKVLSRGLGPI